MSTTTSTLQWHEGEHKMHLLTKVPEHTNPTSLYLNPGAAHMLQIAPLLALGTIDDKGRPWSSIIGGESGLAQPLGNSLVGIRSVVSQIDPVIDILTSGKAEAKVDEDVRKGKMVSGLTIDMEARRRVKLYGRMITHSMTKLDSLDSTESESMAGFAQLVMKIEQSLGNCPKYINCKKIRPALPKPKILTDSIPLSSQALSLVAKADTIFVSSSDHQKDMDTNIRGGPPGFVRVETNDETSTVLVWPEYSGNNLYQTLGNLQVSHRAGLVFPDFETGDVLYVTGDAEVLIGKAAATILPRSKLAVRLTLTGARFVEQGLAFRGSPLQPSPYNPKILYLAGEKDSLATKTSDSTPVTAQLLTNEQLTPTINRYTFRLSNPTTANPWKPGQYVALSFKDELDMGYSHMRDDDPTSLNDDFLRTFTVSSHPRDSGLDSGEFTITVRSVGRVTRYLSQQKPGLEIPLSGFGGDFYIRQPAGGRTLFVAGGIGITPLLPQVRELNVERLRLVWAVQRGDLGLVEDTFRMYPKLAAVTALFVSGKGSALEGGVDVGGWESGFIGASVRYRRLEAADLTSIDAQAWYLCAGGALKAAVLGWLGDTKVQYEDFNY